jgi:hypothetical protein
MPLNSVGRRVIMVNNNMTKKDLLIELETLRARIVQLEKQPKITEQQSKKMIPNKPKDMYSKNYSMIFSVYLKKFTDSLSKLLNITQKYCVSTLIRIKGYILSIVLKVKDIIKSEKIHRLYRLVRIFCLKTMRRVRPLGRDIKELSIKLYQARWGKVTIESIIVLPLILVLSFFAGGKTWFLFPEAIIAWVIFVMALVVFQVIEENRRQQHEQLKQEYNRRVLGEIEHWAKDGTRYSMLCRINGNAKKHEYLVELNILNMLSNDIVNISNSIDGSLSKLVKTAAERLSSNINNDTKSDWSSLEYAYVDVVSALLRYKTEIGQIEKVG